MNSDIEERRHGPSDAMHNPSQPFEFASQLDTCRIYGNPRLKPSSNKLLVGECVILYANQNSAVAGNPVKEVLPKLNLPDHRYKRRCCSLIPAESDSLPHAHTQATKTYYKHQDSRIKKAQKLNTKTSANSDIQNLP
ncbi:hypothetical protein Tco_1311544 [Tanacetum coccineum]